MLSTARLIAIFVFASQFRPDSSNGRRVIVEFDSLDIFSEDGQQRLLRAGFIFTLVRRLRPSLSDGDAGACWLDTTYLTDRLRCGRGNKVETLAQPRSNSFAQYV